ncbi:hypothetical protein K9N08_01585 [Candidatus Gracilibacteria bacterium]|nr:hypothetical protein [Candidatus Gracilibacteria bacterium]MCF7856231.1 hypothetical protein [Candidatus Gracilibacteria bacterium]MCF7896704.1 hypothetical protein [Candidatus Gracilibacteria bacterium]
MKKTPFIVSFVASLRDTYLVLKAKSLTGQVNTQEYRLKLADLLVGLKTAKDIEGADLTEIKSLEVGANELLKALKQEHRTEIDNLLVDPKLHLQSTNTLNLDFSFLKRGEKKT